MSPVFALSIRQPWAWLIVNGLKPLENRTWPTAIRGAIWIHAGQTMTPQEYEECQAFIGGFTDIKLPAYDELQRGGIVGRARLVDCVSKSESPWFVGEFGFVFQEAEPVPFKECRGALGFFRLPPDLKL